MERFHRQLKASLKAYSEPNSWMTTHPFILLGIRTAFKEDIGCTTGELVYDSTLRLQGEFFNQSMSVQTPDQTTYATQLKTAM